MQPREENVSRPEERERRLGRIYGESINGIEANSVLEVAEGGESLGQGFDGNLCLVATPDWYVPIANPTESLSKSLCANRCGGANSKRGDESAFSP